MALETRSVDASRMDRLEEAVKKLQEGSERHDGIIEELKQLMTAVVQKTIVASSSPAESSSNTRGILSPCCTIGSAAVQTRYTRLDFPRFAEENPKGWIYRCESPNIYEDDIGALTKLKQINLVKGYHKRFEELATRTKGLSEEFFVSCFISGLKEEICPLVQMFRPITMIQVVGLAHL
ncbi:hypothetical protein F0562_010514 [Nyssa sinensis]|uniref:Retrotransposon gag domain-containing protein n=1 Tax=Nyssa sinensis TaxID=561372 RepID=A0A5J4ZYY2_9ASTE|nr:hypothetical protein F0562_010514 [Nyssa sinensis]